MCIQIAGCDVLCHRQCALQRTGNAAYYQPSHQSRQQYGHNHNQLANLPHLLGLYSRHRQIIFHLRNLLTDKRHQRLLQLFTRGIEATHELVTRCRTTVHIGLGHIVSDREIGRCPRFNRLHFFNCSTVANVGKVLFKTRKSCVQSFKIGLRVFETIV